MGEFYLLDNLLTGMYPGAEIIEYESKALQGNALKDPSALFLAAEPH